MIHDLAYKFSPAIVSYIKSGEKSMHEFINAKGTGCAEPVILAKKALELYDEITIIVNARTALENLMAFGMHSGCIVTVTEEPGETYTIRMKKSEEQRQE